MTGFRSLKNVWTMVDPIRLGRLDAVSVNESSPASVMMPAVNRLGPPVASTGANAMFSNPIAPSGSPLRSRKRDRKLPSFAWLECHRSTGRQSSDGNGGSGCGYRVTHGHVRIGEILNPGRPDQNPIIRRRVSRCTRIGTKSDRRNCCRTNYDLGGINRHRRVGRSIVRDGRKVENYRCCQRNRLKEKQDGSQTHVAPLNLTCENCKVMTVFQSREYPSPYVLEGAGPNLMP
jgi:hypothetical protein